jgi:hypothetical protein
MRDSTLDSGFFLPVIPPKGFEVYKGLCSACHHPLPSGKTVSRHEFCLIFEFEIIAKIGFEVVLSFVWVAYFESC